MADTTITDPVVTFSIRLKRRFYLRVVVWATEADMHANTPEISRKDFTAIFISGEEGGRCIGTINLSVDASNGVRAHEIRHAVDEFCGRAFEETLAAVTEKITDEIDSTLSARGSA